MFEFPTFLPPTNLGLLMHSPSALTEHVSLNLARFFCSTLYRYDGGGGKVKIVQTSHVYMAPSSGQCMGWKIGMERRAAAGMEDGPVQNAWIGTLLKNKMSMISQTFVSSL